MPDAPASPPIVPHEEWLRARIALLEREKELTRTMDRVNAERRRLPMVRLEKAYGFDAPEGRRTLAELFEGRPQLIVYHFMFDPAWDEGCPGCTSYIDALGDLSMLAERNTSFVVVSRAPLAKLEAYRAQRGWDIRWVSSSESDFNYDFHVTADASVAPIEYNYRKEEEAELNQTPGETSDEQHGISVFFQVETGSETGGEVFHTYSAYARGVEGITDAYALLDLTPYGRQEDFEDSPEGWPQRPTYG